MSGAYCGFGNAPTSYLAYFASQASWTVTSNYANASVTGSEGFVGSIYISLDEVNSAVKYNL
jgi:hypothetical protein